MSTIKDVLLRKGAPANGWGKIVRGTAKHMKGSELKVYCELISYADKEKALCWPSVDTIASGTGMTRRYVQTALSSLEDSGWLKRSFRTNNSTIYQMYYMKGPNKKESEEKEKSPEVSKKTIGVSKIYELGVPKLDIQRDQLKRPIKETNLLTKSDDFQEDFLEGFDGSVLQDLIAEANNSATYKYIREVAYQVTKDESIKRWSESVYDDELIKKLAFVQKHLISEKLDYGLKKATTKELLRFGDILAPAIATIKY